MVHHPENHHAPCRSNGTVHFFRFRSAVVTMTINRLPDLRSGAYHS